MNSIFKILCLLFVLVFPSNFLSAQILSPAPLDSVIAGKEIDFKFQISSNTLQELHFSLDKKVWQEIGVFANREILKWFPPYDDIDSLFFRYNAFSFTEPVKLKEINSAHAAEISSLDYEPLDSVFLSASLDGKIYLWSLQSFEKVDSIDVKKKIYSAKFFGSSERIVFASENSIFLFEPKGKTRLKLLDTCQNLVRTLAVAERTKILVCGSYSGEVFVFDSTLSKIYSLQTGKQIYSLAFSSDGEWLALGDYNGFVTIFDLKTQKVVAEISTNRDSTFKNVVWSIAFSLDDSLLACGGIDGKVRVYSLSNFALEYVLPSHTFHIRGVGFPRYAPVVTSVSLDSTFSQIFFARNFAVHQPIKQKSAITSLIFLDGGRFLLLGLRNGDIVFYKNFDFQEIEQNLALPYFIPVAVKCRSFQAFAGRLEPVPIVFENIYEIPLRRFNSDTSFVVLHLPKEHFGVYHSETSRLVLGDFDTVFSDLLTIGKKDTFAVISVYTLHPWSERKATFGIQSISFRGKRNIQWLIETDTVEIVEKCKPISDLVRFELIPQMDFDIVEDTKSDEVYIKFLSNERIFCNLVMFNLLGGNVEQIFSGEVEKGEYLISTDLKGIPSGTYLVILQTKYQSLAKKLILSR